jgi:3-hydroxyacyl-CoA dehydrogenase
LDLILSAKPIGAQQAQELGLLDQTIEGDLKSGAIGFARSQLATGKGPRRTGEMRVDPATASDEMFALQAEQARKLYPNRNAGLVAVEAVRKSAASNLAEGLEFETALVNECKTSAESRGAVHVFFAERDSRRVPGIGDDVRAASVKSAAIVGAGTMGGGIAICFANAGIPVTLIDAKADSLERGLASVARTYQSMVERGRLKQAEVDQRLALIRTSLDFADVAQADVIVEAVFESMDLKREVFAKLDAIARPGAVLATNTSTLDIEVIANATSRPADVIGMHFFSPANVMPLLEVVRTASTSPAIIKTVMELAKPLRKTPVLARVCYGFVGNRMMEGYAREAQRIVLEGATPRQVDSALEDWGMAMGILAVFDMAGIDVGVNVHKANASQYPPDPAYYQADIALYDAGRMGQKNGKGYYRYEAGKRARIDDPEAVELLARKARDLKIPPRSHSVVEIQERCVFPLLNEGFRVLGEGIVLRAADIDVVWTSGYGFPRYRGGPMFHAQEMGLRTLLDGMRRYRDIFGRMHWEPAPLLVELVEKKLTIAEWESQQRAKGATP